MKQKFETRSRLHIARRFESRDEGDADAQGSWFELLLFTIFFVFVFSYAARANSATSAVSTTSPGAKAVSARALSYSGSFLIETTRTLSENESTSYGGLYQATLGVSHKASGVAGGLKLGYTQEYSYERDDGTTGSFENPLASVSKTWQLGTVSAPGLIDSVKWGLAGSLPGNRESQRRKFLGSMGTSVAVAKKFARVNLSQSFSYTYGFYEYDIRDDGTVNSPSSYRSMTELELAMTEKLSLSASFVYNYSVSFQDVGRAMESSSLGLDYALTDKIALSAGVANERGTLEPDGQSNRVKFFEQDSAQAYFDLVVSI